MAQIPVNYKLSFYDPAQPTAVITTVNENVNDATRVNTQYSMQETTTYNHTKVYIDLVWVRQ